MKIILFFLDTDGKSKRNRSHHWPWKKISRIALALIVAALPLIQKLGDMMSTPVTYAQIEAFRIRPIEPLPSEDSAPVKSKK